MFPSNHSDRRITQVTPACDVADHRWCQLRPTHARSGPYRPSQHLLYRCRHLLESSWVRVPGGAPPNEDNAARRSECSGTIRIRVLKGCPKKCSCARSQMCFAVALRNRSFVICSASEPPLEQKPLLVSKFDMRQLCGM